MSGGGNLRGGGTRRLATLAVLTAISLTIFIAEAQIPVPSFLPPGIKLGLANIVTLFTMVVLGRRDAGIMLFGRILLGSMFSGSFSAIMYSLGGGACAFLVMSIALAIVGDELVWVVSVLGAIAHNLGQLTVAVLILGRIDSIVVYGAMLIFAAVITGAFTGFCTGHLIARFAPQRS